MPDIWLVDLSIAVKNQFFFQIWTWNSAWNTGLIWGYINGNMMEYGDIHESWIMNLGIMNWNTGVGFFHMCHGSEPVVSWFFWVLVIQGNPYVGQYHIPFWWCYDHQVRFVFFPSADAWNMPRDIAIDFFQIGKIVALTCVRSSSANLDKRG